MRFVSILAGFLLLALPTQAQELRILTEEFPPYNYSESGQPKGLSTDVVRAALAKAGLTAEPEFLPWARAYLTAQNRKNTLIYSIARIPEREQLFTWVGVIAPYNTSLYKLAERTDINVTSLEEAKAYSIGVSLEDVIYQYLKGEGFAKLDLVGEDVLNLRKLALGRLDLVAFAEASFHQRIAKEGLDPALFERVYRLDNIGDSLYMALNKDSDPELVTAITDGLDAIKANGTYDQILADYSLMY